MLLDQFYPFLAFIIYFYEVTYELVTTLISTKLRLLANTRLVDTLELILLLISKRTTFFCCQCCFLLQPIF